jgi:hypothetical protein
MMLGEVLSACKQWACDESRELATAGTTLDLGSLELRHAAVNVGDAGQRVGDSSKFRRNPGRGRRSPCKLPQR